MRKLPNIILIVCDTLGAKHMSLYGYHRKTTPNLERMVEEDNFTVYTRCFSPAPWTTPAHASLFTGLYPSEHRCDGTNIFLGKNILSLPLILKETGYRTYGISNNFLINQIFCQGFENFYEVYHLFNEDEIMSKLSQFQFFSTNRKEMINFIRQEGIKPGNWASIFKGFSNIIYNKKFNVIDNSKPFTRKTYRFVKNLLVEAYHAEKPFFIFVNFMQTHDSYNPPEETRNYFGNSIAEYEDIKYDVYGHYLKKYSNEYLKYLEKKYDEEILYLDTVICQLSKYLDRIGLRENTLFIITSDHGELFGEHGHVQHLFTTYNELIHVPLLIRYPKDVIVSDTCKDIVQLHDLFATILDLVDAPFPIPNSSKSLLSSEKREFAVAELLDVEFKIQRLLQKDPKFDIENFTANCSERSLITSNLKKLIIRSNGLEEFYDLSRDFYETDNLISSKEYAADVSDMKLCYAAIGV